jgi:D-lactate dehydrogenase (cytochrome)
VIFVKDQSALGRFFEDNSGMRGANAEFAAIAENEDDVVNFISEAASKNLSITIAGALTANTGAALPYGGAVLSLERLNAVSAPQTNSKQTFMNVQAGARLVDIKNKAAGFGFMYPPDPTEQNSLIGGNISTNASGARGFKFGATRKYVKGLKIIFTDGSKAWIERGKTFANSAGEMSFQTDKGKKTIVLPKYKLPNIKNAAGFFNYPNADLIDVFIGSEGTLGIILEADLLLINSFKSAFSGIVFFESQDNLFDFVDKVKSGEKVKAMSIEYFDANTLNLVRGDYPFIPQKAQGAIMFEQDVYEYDMLDEVEERWFEIISDSGADADEVWFADTPSEISKILAFRHKIPEKANEIVHKTGIAKVGTDFAVPDGNIREILDFCRREFDRSGIFNITFGHIGENHIHANIIAQDERQWQAGRQIYERIVQKVIDIGGTASAEHGIGKIRHIFLEKMVSKEGLFEMARFKNSLDPAKILGRDNI